MLVLGNDSSGGGQVSYNEELSSYVTIDNKSVVQAMYLTTTETFSSNGYLLNIPDVEQHLFSLESESTSYSYIFNDIFFYTNTKNSFFFKTFTTSGKSSVVNKDTKRLTMPSNPYSTTTFTNSTSSKNYTMYSDNVQYSDFYTDIIKVIDRCINTTYNNINNDIYFAYSYNTTYTYTDGADLIGIYNNIYVAHNNGVNATSTLTYYNSISDIYICKQHQNIVTLTMYILSMVIKIPYNKLQIQYRLLVVLPPIFKVIGILSLHGLV